MPQREFELTISPTGEVEIHVKGYKGRRCLEAMKFFQEIVGELKQEQHTSEYYEPEEDVSYRVENRQ